ncbi:hypothetical protein [Pseudomonas sp. TWI628]|uniref:hypothetical protein n=1 Tax=Pseudomonas sp. TWI628 TaxID=3136788 RepID=UPI003209AC54
MIVVKDVRAWINGNVYVDLLKLVVEQLKLPVNFNPVPDVALQLDADKLNLAKLDPAALIAAAENSDLTCRYIAGKLKSLSELSEEQEGKNRKMKMM